MEHSQKELRAVYDKASKAEHQLISVLFANRKSSEVAIGQLRQRGYSKEDIKILSPHDLLARPCLVPGEAIDTDKTTVRKAFQGIKIGAILGIIISVILILSMKNTAEPALFEILLVPVGAIDGAVMGFLLGPLFPFSQHQYYKRDLIDGNVLIQFWTKSRKERTYFEQMKWTICQLGLQ